MSPNFETNDNNTSAFAQNILKTGVHQKLD